MPIEKSDLVPGKKYGFDFKVRPRGKFGRDTEYHEGIFLEILPGITEGSGEQILYIHLDSGVKHVIAWTALTRLVGPFLD